MRRGRPAPLALRPRDAARALGIGRRALWTLTADRTSGIPHTRIGRAVMYPVRELRDWLARRASENSAAATGTEGDQQWAQ